MKHWVCIWLTHTIHYSMWFKFLINWDANTLHWCLKVLPVHKFAKAQATCVDYGVGSVSNPCRSMNNALPAIFQQGGVNPGLLIQQLSCIPLPPVLSLRFVHFLENPKVFIQAIIYIQCKNKETHQLKKLIRKMLVIVVHHINIVIFIHGLLFYVVDWVVDWVVT